MDVPDIVSVSAVTVVLTMNGCCTRITCGGYTGPLSLGFHVNTISRTISRTSLQMKDIPYRIAAKLDGVENKVESLQATVRDDSLRNIIPFKQILFRILGLA